MLTRISLSLALLAAQPIWAQATIDEDTQMLTPPPVSGQAYPTTVGTEVRSNYLACGLILNTAYDDNIFGAGSTTPVRDVTYSMWPTITLSLTTSRQHRTLTYSPGFTFYQHTSALNAVDQNAALNLQYRLSPHTTISLIDSFEKSSNIFNQPYFILGGVISGLAQPPPTEVVAPYADLLINTGNMELSYQFSTNSMIGFGALVTQSDYSNSAEASGLSNSKSLGGLVFYSQRLFRAQYVGLTYQYLDSRGNIIDPQAGPANAHNEVQTHTPLLFYTAYLNPTLSLSLSIGPQYFEATQPPFPPFRSWVPSTMASIGWQRSHTNLVASYTRTVTGGVGLLGAFDSNSAIGSATWQMARAWTVGSGASYSLNKNIVPLLFSSSPGGHTLTGSFSIQHVLGQHLSAELGFAHLRQSYSGIAVISNTPDSNRVYISVSYQFTRALGR